MKFTSACPFRAKVFFLFFLQPAVKTIVSVHTDELRWEFSKIIHCGLQVENCESNDLSQLQIVNLVHTFEKGYNLLQFSDVEAYVNQNKHLHEDSSAKDMNLLLLRKIKAQTLHYKSILQLKEESSVSPVPRERKVKELALH